MKDKATVRNALLRQRLLPLYHHADAEVSKNVLRALYQSGIRILEYTNRGPAAFGNYQQLLKMRDQEMPDLILGVGTIKTLQAAQHFISAGADFLVSPNAHQEVITYARVQNIFHIPGCMTPTEIAMAEEHGADFIKLFPGNLLGSEFLSSIREIFPVLHFMPTGGVEPTPESAEAWFKAGASALGMGSRLVNKKLMDTGDYNSIQKATAHFLNVLDAVK